MYSKLELNGALLCEHDTGDYTKKDSLSDYEVVNVDETWFLLDKDNDSQFLIQQTKNTDECDGRAGIFGLEDGYDDELTIVVKYDDYIVLSNQGIADTDYYQYFDSPQLNNYPYYYKINNQSKHMDLFCICTAGTDSSFDAIEYNYLLERLTGITADCIPKLVIPLGEDNDLLFFTNSLTNYDAFTRDGGFIYESQYRDAASDGYRFTDAFYRDSTGYIYALDDTVNKDIKESKDYGETYSTWYNSGIIKRMTGYDDDIYVLFDTELVRRIPIDDINNAETYSNNIPATANDMFAIDNEVILYCDSNKLYKWTPTSTTLIYAPTGTTDILGVCSPDNGKTIVITTSIGSPYKAEISFDSGATFESVKLPSGSDLTLTNVDVKPRCRIGGVVYFNEGFSLMKLI